MSMRLRRHSSVWGRWFSMGLWPLGLPHCIIMSASTEDSSVLIRTINDCPSMRVVGIIGPVYGTGVRSRNIVGNFLGGVRAIFGGKQAGYLKMIARHGMMPWNNWPSMPGPRCQCRLGLRFDSGEFDSGQGQAMNEVTAYWTAVVVEPQ